MTRMTISQYWSEVSRAYHDWLRSIEEKHDHFLISAKWEYFLAAKHNLEKRIKRTVYESELDTN